LTEHDVGALLRRAVDTARSDAKGRSVEVILHPGRQTGRAFVDGPRMTEAVANLVRNGIRFTPDGGTVEIRSHRDGDTIVIEVADSGIGISEDQARTLFDPAVMIRDSTHHHSSDTLAFNSEGMGLGLSIARGIVEFHGGTLEVESSVGRGSRFRIRIPAGAAHRDPRGEGASEHEVPIDFARADFAPGSGRTAGRRAATKRKSASTRPPRSPKRPGRNVAR
jgi:signal transduction histidine kinase